MVVDRGVLRELAGLSDVDGVLSVYATVDPAAPQRTHPAGRIRLRHEFAKLRDRAETQGAGSAGWRWSGG